MLVEPALNGFENVLMFPSGDPSFLAGGASGLDCTALADVGPVTRSMEPATARTAQATTCPSRLTSRFISGHVRFNLWFPRLENRFEVRGNRTGKGWFVKGRSAKSRPKEPRYCRGTLPTRRSADRRPISNLVVEARKFPGLAVDTLVELRKNARTDSTRYAAATALLDRGYDRPAQSLDLHLSADAIKNGSAT